MSEPGKLGIQALEGPLQNMGRRGSFQPLETTTFNTDQTFGSPKVITGGFDLGTFDFVKSVTTDPTIPKFSDDSSKDNPMKYKRTVRRVSLISSDGTFQMDFLHHQGKTNKTLTQDIKTVIPPTMGVIVEDRSLAIPSSQVTQPSETSDVETAITVPSSSSSRRRRQSIVDLVEENKLMAVAADKLTANDDRLAAKPLNEEEPKGLVGTVLNSWFFRGTDSDDNREEVPSHQMEGVGGGQLTSKVINALGMQAPTKQESRKMNLWMPQGM